MRPRRTAIKSDIVEAAVYLPYLCRANWQYVRYREQGKPAACASKVVVSLTSFPARFGKLHNCLKALIGQTVRPDRLVLYLSLEECSGHELPRAVTSLQKYGLEIRFAGENCRSLNKIIHALDDFPDHIIVTCDDDKLYPPDWLEKLVAGHLAFPDNIACLRSRMIAMDENGKLLPYRLWPEGKAGLPCHTTFPLGVGGVIYPPGCFTDDVMNTKLFRELCPASDDLWLKFMAMINNRTAVQLGKGCEQHPSIPYWNGQKLSVGNIWSNGNDEALHRLITHFNISPEYLAQETRIHAA